MENTIGMNNSYSAPYIDIELNTDVQEDISLADYYPDVNRVLFVTARAVPEGKFISGNEIDCDGIVSFNLTYLGADGTIASIPVTAQYTQSASLPDPVGVPGEIICRSYAVSPSCRVTSPRTISLKAHLTTNVFCTQRIESEVVITDEALSPVSPDKEITVEKDMIEYPTVSLYYGACSDVIEGEIDETDVDRIISADAVINIIDTRIEESKTTVKAEAILSVFYITTEGIYKSERTRVPFDSQVQIKSLKPGDCVSANAVIASVEVSITDSGITYSIEYDMDINASSKDVFALCRDAFSTEYLSEPEITDINVLEFIKVSNAHLTQTGELKRHGEAKDGEYVIDTVATAQADSITVDDNKMTIIGVIDVQSAIWQDGDVVSEDGKIPFTYTCDILPTDGNPVIFTNIVVTNVSSRIDSSTLSITAELSLSITALAESSEEAVSKLIINTTEMRTNNCFLKICFPDEKESIWSICKRYGCSQSTIEKINGWQQGQDSIGKGPIIIE